MSLLKSQIDAFLARKFGDWAGLPSNCHENDILTWYNTFLDGTGIVRRGKSQIEYSFRVMSHPLFTQGIEFYFSNGMLQFLEVGYWSNDQDECSQLINHLGEPNQRLDFYWRGSTEPSGLLLWSGHGIALGIPPKTRLISCLTAFPACTPDFFVKHYFQESAGHEFRHPEQATNQL